MDANGVREGAPSPEPAKPNVPSAVELLMPPPSTKVAAPMTPSPVTPLTDATYSLSEDTPMKSSPTASSPKCLPPTGSTIAELLRLEGLELQDILTIQVDGEPTKVIQKGTEWWKIIHEVVGDKDSWRLVHPRQTVKAAIVQCRLAERSNKGKARDVDATVSAKTEDIVDRIGDPGYKDWVTKILKPRVQGSRLVVTEPPRKSNDKGAFWWMSNLWGEAYRNDADLGRVVLNQIAAVNNHPDRHTWTGDKKSITVGGIEFKLKDFDVGSQLKLGITARQLCQTCGNPHRCQACTSCPQCSFCKATGACGFCVCCQFTCCCRFPNNTPQDGPFACRTCGSCGDCGCCRGTCCCARRLDIRFPDVPPGVGCERCREERKLERADGQWSMGKYWGTPTGMAGRGVMVCEPPRAILPKLQPRNGVKKETPWKKSKGAGHVPSIKKEAHTSSSSKSPSLNSMTLDQLEQELAAKERELAQLRAKQEVAESPLESPVAHPPQPKVQPRCRSAMDRSILAAIQEAVETELEEGEVDKADEG